MASKEGGRWDVGTKDNAVCLERISDSDERLFDDLLEPEEARELAGLLTKYADKADESDGSEDSDDEDSDDENSDDENSDDAEDSDNENSDESSD
ncbi:MAG: hypothetical protein WCB92_21180 [Mycobacterium sp.]